MSFLQRLTADSIVLAYGERQVLRGAALEMNTGQVLGLLGLNGSGKSSLLEVIFGSRAAAQATVQLNGRWHSALYRVKNAVMYLPQKPLLPDSVRLRTALDMYVPDHAKRLRLSQRPEFQPFLKEPARSLSGGERRLAEALLLINSEAHFLLLDKLFAGLSPLQAGQLDYDIRETQPHKGILLTDQHYENVFALSSRLLLLQAGQLQRINSREELSELGYLPV